MLKFIFLAIAVVFPTVAWSQSSPGFTYGQVPTTAQWNNAFIQKQDTLGFTPVNRAGDTMVGRLRTTASTLTSAGFSLLPGVAPTSPNNGDVWLTSSGLYVRVNGSTIGPISNGNVTGPSSSIAGDIVIFADTSGSVLQDSGKSLPTGALVGTTDAQVLTNKSISADQVNSGTLGGARLPSPTTSVLGGVLSATATGNNFQTGINTSGAPTFGVPNVASILGYTPLNPANNLSDVANPATAAANIGAVSTSAVNTFTATQKWAKGADIASAAALTPGSDGNYFNVTGTTTITSIASVGTGVWLKVHFNAALTLTNSANLVLPGGANITTAAGDEAEFVQSGVSTWRCTSYTRASGLPISSIQQSSTVTLSGSAVDFSIPAGAKRVSINLDSVSTTGTATFIAQLGDAGGVETTGYQSGSTQSSVGNAAGLTNITNGLYVGVPTAANATFSGTGVFNLLDAASAKWTWSSNINDSTNSRNWASSGSKALSPGPLTTVRLTTTGADTFDGGTASATWEF